MGVAAQLAALAFFNRVLGLGALIATAAAVETAVLHNFIWHERYTWADRIAGFGIRRSRHDRASGSGIWDSQSDHWKRRSFFETRIPNPKSHAAEVLRRLFLFNLTNGSVSLVGNVMLTGFLLTQAHLPLLAANLVSITCCALVNFTVSDRWVFR